MKKLIKLHPLDNVVILTEEIQTGEYLEINGLVVQVEKNIGLGHKMAEKMIEVGQKIIKHGVPIGSATATIEIGTHIHLHNMKSDYIPTYTIEDRIIKDNQ